MQANIAIVIAAFNRPHALNRLLTSIQNAAYSTYHSIPLVISIDYSGNEECYEVADAFDWRHGTKTVIKHPQNLKLKGHIIKCGNLTTAHDAIIMLEDDLFVAPQFYTYAQEAYQFYKEDESLAGIALYNYRYNEFAYCPFEPIADGSDTYFMQVPCSCGQLWTKNQWQSFVQYLATETEDEHLFLPQEALNWPVATSWKRSFFKYMVVCNKYFVYPRVSVTTNFGDVGQHYADAVYIWQTPLLYGRKNYQFVALAASASVYDSFFELTESSYNKLTNQNLSISFDINGIKPLLKITTEYLISSKYCSNPQSSYLPALYPYECNVLQQIKGDASNQACFSLGKTSAFKSHLHFNRLAVDVSRTFFHIGYVTNAAKEEVYQSTPYRMGWLLLAPRRFLQRVLTRLQLIFKSANDK